MRPNSLLPTLAAAALLAGCGLRSAPPPELAQPPALELRLADVVPQPGWISIQLPDPPTPLFLDPGMVVGTSDFSMVAASPTPEGLRLDLSLTAAGADRLARATGENVGRWLALVTDGRLRSAAPIARSIGTEGAPLQVELRLHPLEARRLREGIEAAWPPLQP